METLRINLAACLVAALTLSACTSANPVEPLSSFTRFEEVLDNLRADSHISAISVAIARDQSIVYAKGFGIADISAQRPATDTTEQSRWATAFLDAFVIGSVPLA
jgi:CubicO group peptidase (beta-lactamase class C family)